MVEQVPRGVSPPCFSPQIAGLTSLLWLPVAPACNMRCAFCADRTGRANEMNGVLLKDFMAAVSVGVVEGRPVLDLCYLEDAQAAVDMNVVMTAAGRFIEVQGTAESEPFDDSTLQEMLGLARSGIARLVEKQKEVLGIASLAR